MNQPDPPFRLVMRGYDPADVDRALAGLQQRAADAEASAAEFESRWQQASASAEAGPAEPPGYDHLGQRIGQILALADEEAKELRDRAHAEAEDVRKLADQAAVSVRD